MVSSGHSAGFAVGTAEGPGADVGWALTCRVIAEAKSLCHDRFHRPRPIGPNDPAREKHHEPSNSPRSHVAWNRPCGGVGRDRASGRSPADRAIPYVTAKDGTKLFVQDWGNGKPVVLLSAWTFDASSWGSQIAALDAKGFRCVAPDRRGHGRSEMPSSGYDLETLTDDVAAVIEARDLRDVTLVGFSMGTAEAVNYLGRYGSDRIARLVLVAPTTPFLVKTEDNPDAVPKAMIEADNAAVARDFAKWIAANEAPFFTRTRPRSRGPGSAR